MTSSAGSSDLIDHAISESTGKSTAEPTGAPPAVGKPKVFISYSREDLTFADRLAAELDLHGFECAIDRHSIVSGEDWRRRLSALIAEADTVVFMLSPESSRSENCAWEVEEAARKGKRIFPVVCRAMEGESVPEKLSKLNYVFLYDEPRMPESGFSKGISRLVSALMTDLAWVREHTRILIRAQEWDYDARSADRLLRGDEIRKAETWAARRPREAPELTPVQLEFIKASEDFALSERRLEEARLKERDDAVTAREKAQKARAIFSYIALGLGVLAFGFGLQAESRRQTTEHILDDVRTLATTQYKRLDGIAQAQIFEIFRKGTESGDAKSMATLGTFYLEGIGTVIDYAKALDWYRRAEKSSDPLALNGLALMYFEGRGVPGDLSKAREFIQRAVDLNDAAAMFSLSALYFTASDGQQNDTKAAELAEKSASRGYPTAMYVTGTNYYGGLGVGKDRGKAASWFQKGADSGDGPSMAMLGAMYADGDGVPKDEVKSRQLLENAIRTGDEQPFFEISRATWKKSADTVLSNAIIRLHGYYVDGVGGKVNVDNDQSLDRYILNQVNPALTFEVGMRYFEAADNVKARPYFDAAAARGDMDGMNMLGSFLFRGLGGAKDIGKACDLFQRSAKLGNTFAMISFGNRFLDGECGFKDPIQARQWYRKAAEAGNAEGMLKLADLLAASDEENDRHEATRWYDAAAEKGSLEAKGKLAALRIEAQIKH